VREMNWPDIRRRLTRACEACEAVGASDTQLSIEPPATPSEVAAVEQSLGLTLPAALRTTFLEFSAGVLMYWSLQKKAAPPFKDIFSGTCDWSLRGLPTVEEGRKGWISTCFPNPEDPYDRVWHGKLAFGAVGNGDMLAIDLGVPGEPVVYLSHEDSQIHGWRLGDNFFDFLDRSSRLGFVGAEDWQLEPFLGDSTSGLQPDSANGQVWREWFGISNMSEPPGPA
jgi:hypothetical protein